MTADAERRELSFSSFDEVLAEAERLASGEVRVSGNHSFAEILRHLAIAHNTTCGKTQPPKPPLFLRLMMPFIKGFIVKGPVKPGFKLPSESEAYFWPTESIEVAEAMNQLKESIDYFQSNGPTPVHPVFGKVDREAITRMNLGHCAMHLSFVHPA